MACTINAQAKDYRVDPTGKQGEYSTVQQAVDAVSDQTDADRANIYIAPGTYTEQVVVDKPYVSFIGTGQKPDDVKITESKTPISGVTFNETLSVRGNATGFMARNLTFENSTPDHNATQALALRSSADKAIYDHVRLLGYQDTLLVDNKSRQYFVDSFISGDTDFIFGDATAVFDHATIESTDGNYITAARTADTTANGLVFLDSKLVKGTDRNPEDDGSKADRHEVYLGRPWRSQDPGVTPSTLFIRTRMDDHIRPAGWDPWQSPNGEYDAVSRYAEFGSMDIDGNLLPLDEDGIPVGRVLWADALTEAQAEQYTLDHIFGLVDYWNTHPGVVPEGTGVIYLPQGDGQAWNPLAQLRQLPPVPEPSAMGMSAALSVLLAGGQRPRRQAGTK